jgi:acetyl-CoA carboxylase carboxyltransferase component
MYEEHGGCPSGGVVIKIGYVSGKQCIVVTNDATSWRRFLLPLRKIYVHKRNCNGKQTIIYLVDCWSFCHYKMKFSDKEHLENILEIMP